MATVKHSFHSNKSDGTDATLIQPSYWNDDHDIQVSTTNVVLGRKTAGAGPVEEIPISQVGGVTSVAGRTGTVVLAKADITDAGTAVGFDVVLSSSAPSGTPTKPTIWIQV